MIGPEDRRDLASIRELARRRTGEADGERLHGLAHLLRHERDDQARVESAAEHRAERNVGHETEPHGLPKRLEQALRVLADVGTARRARDRRILPVLLDDDVARRSTTIL